MGRLSYLFLVQRKTKQGSHRLNRCKYEFIGFYKCKEFLWKIVVGEKRWTILLVVSSLFSVGVPSVFSSQDFILVPMWKGLYLSLGRDGVLGRTKIQYSLPLPLPLPLPPYTPHPFFLCLWFLSYEVRTELSSIKVQK